MTNVELEIKLANTYLSFLKNLSDDIQLDIIAKISNSLKSKKNTVKTDSYFSGIRNSDETAEQLILEIKNARVSNRKTLDL